MNFIFEILSDKDKISKNLKTIFRIVGSLLFVLGFYVGL